MESISYIIEGFARNIFTTAVAMALPLLFGILLSLGSKKSSVVNSVYNWLKIPCESIAIPIVIMLVFYTPGLLFDIPIFSYMDRFFYKNFEIQDASRVLVITVVMSIAYFWYMPGRYDRNYSFWRNTLLNSLGLFSALFKWSFVAKLLTIRDALGASVDLAVQKALIWPLLLVFAAVSALLIVVEIAKALIKQFMK